MAVVVELVTYPVKGCAGTSLRATTSTPTGLPHDRSFMVVDENGRFLSQRRDPRLAVVRPAVDGGRLVLEAPGTGPVQVDIDLTAPRRDVELFGTGYRGIDQGDKVAGWFSGLLDRPARLVRVPPEHDRVADGLVPGPSGWADSCAVLLASRSSLELLHRRLAEKGAGPVPMERFRPNIVIDGTVEEPHAEDRFGRVRVGGTELGFAKIAVRCAVTTVDQGSGVRQGPEPLRTLAGYRRAKGGVTFGAKFAVVRTGPIAVGDELVVQERATAGP